MTNLIKVCKYFHREKIVVSKVLFNLVEKGIFMTGSGILTYSNRNNFNSDGPGEGSAMESAASFCC